MTDQTTIPDEPQTSELQTSLDTVQREIAAFQKIQAGIAELRKNHPVDLVLDVKTPQGMRDAIAGRAAWRDPRVAVEKVRKAAKAPVLELGKRIDAFAGQLTDELLIGESNYDDQIKVEQKRIEDEKEAKRLAEVARVQAIRDRIAVKFSSLPARAFGQPAAKIEQAITAVAGVDMDSDEAKTVYAELLPEASLAQAAALQELRSMHATALAAEQEAERQRLLAEENARQAQKLADERAEFERQQEQARKEREAIEAQQRADREAHDVEQRAREEAIRAEQQRLDDAKRAEADRLAAIERKRLDDEAAEQRQKEAEEIERINRETAERVARIQAVQIEAAKKAEKEYAAEQRRLKKLAAVQKAGPRLLAALKDAKHMLERDPIDDAKYKVIEKCQNLIDELEGSEE